MEKIEKATVLVYKIYCEDDYYHDYKLFWEEVPYLTPEKREKKEKRYRQYDGYYGMGIYFLDAVKIDGKIFMDVESLLGNSKK